MKRTLLYIATGVVLTSFLQACDDEFSRPPVVLPEVAQIEPTVAVADFKTTYWSTITQGPTTIPYGVGANDTLILRGRVCSSDESGNIYKNIIVQGHDEQGRQIAFCFGVNATKLYQSFPFGQEVAIYASGLSIGPYRNLLQFGAINGDQMSFMDESTFTAHVVRTGEALPRPSEVDTTLAEIKHVNEIKSNSDSLMMWQSRLVRFNDVYFEDAGQPFAGDATVNRYIVDKEGNRMIVRNSSYSTFNYDKLPYGTGSVVGILSYYASDWQVLLIDENGCIDFDGIEPEPPTVEPVDPTIGMAEFKARYWSTITEGPKTIPDGEKLVMTGRVCSSDETGNIYKNIIVQGRDEKGRQVALCFGVNATKLYQNYPFGQEVAIYADGLSIGPYRNLLQFGAINGDQMAFMDESLFKTHVVIAGEGAPRPSEVDTTKAEIKHVNEIKTNSDSLMLWQSRLVRFDNVYFEEAGQPFAGDATVNRYIVDNEGNKMIVRNSSYATFGKDKLPAGTGSVVGILSYYASDWQVLLIDKNGCINFDGQTPVTPPSTGSAVYQSLSSTASELPEGWTFENVELGSLPSVWSWKVYEKNGYLNASAYSSTGNVATKSYAVSPVIDLGGYSKCSMSFDHAAKFQTTLRTLCGVSVRLEGEKDWTDVAVPSWPDAGAWKFVSSGAIDLSAYDGKKIQVAFRYGSTVQGADTWEIQNLIVNGTK